MQHIKCLSIFITLFTDRQRHGVGCRDNKETLRVSDPLLVADHQMYLQGIISECSLYFIRKLLNLEYE